MTTMFLGIGCFCFGCIFGVSCALTSFKMVLGPNMYKNVMDEATKPARLRNGSNGSGNDSEERYN